MDAEIEKLIAETVQIQAQARWFPFLAVAVVFALAIIVVKFLP